MKVLGWRQVFKVFQLSLILRTNYFRIERCVKWAEFWDLIRRGVSANTRPFDTWPDGNESGIGLFFIGKKTKRQRSNKRKIQKDKKTKRQKDEQGSRIIKH